MNKDLISGAQNPPHDLQDITSVWNRCHAHLRPLENALPQDASSDAGVEVFAHVRLVGGQWFEVAKIIYQPATGRFVWPLSERQVVLAGHADLLDAPVDAVDARLWSAEPTMINIEPTTRCNFNCWYCIGRHMKQADIEVADFGNMLNNFPKLKTIALVGEGEPLMHKGFFVMAQMARERGIRVMIISNGSAFSQSVIEQLCETEVAYVSISIDSYDPDTFASSRLDGELAKVWRGIRKLRDYRDAHGYSFPKIALKGTLFSHTIDQLPQIVEEAKKHGVEIFESFQPLNPMKSYIKIYPQAHLGQLSSVTQVAKVIADDSTVARQSLQAFEDFCKTENIDFYPESRTNPARKNCNESYLYSLLSGDVTPCCQIKTPISPKWNIFKHAAEDIRADPEYENVRFNLWNGIFPSYCEGCWKTR